MQRFIGTYGQQSQEIELEPLGEGRYVVTVAGRRHEVDARRFAGGNWSIIIDGQSFDCELEVSSKQEVEGGYNCLLRGRVVSLTVQDERRIRMQAGARKLKVEGPQMIVSPMPGKVVKILVEEGAEVAEGQPLVIVEAMKMENELRAPAAGKIGRIYVQAGQNVESSAKLLALE